MRKGDNLMTPKMSEIFEAAAENLDKVSSSSDCKKDNNDCNFGDCRDADCCFNICRSIVINICELEID